MTATTQTSGAAPMDGASEPRRAFFGPQDVRGDYADRRGDPGTFPYTRGTRVPVPRADRGASSREQIVRELSGEGPASRSNEQFHYLLAHGATGLDVIGDTPTQAFMDPDHPFAAHAVGNQGVSLCRRADFLDLYAGVLGGSVSVSHSLPGGFTVAGLYLAAQHYDVDPAIIRGSAILPPLFAEDTCYSSNLPLEVHMRLATDSIMFCSEHMPRFHPFVEDTYYISDGSVDAVEEMALGFVELREVVRRLVARGAPVDSFAPRIALLVNCRMNLFEEVAKIRASRRLYARMMRDEFGAADPRSLAVNVAAHTSGATMTSAQLVNNVIRGAIQTVALTMAGVRAMEVSAFDEAIRTPSAAAHMVGLRTQQIVQLETDVADVADPLGGSYFIESLTDDLEERIRARIDFIEGLGDIAALSSGGFFRAVFEEAMIDRAREVRDGSQIVVGVNAHVIAADQDTLLRDIAEERIDPHYELIDSVKAWRGTRDLKKVVHALDRLEAVARDRSANTIPAIVAAFNSEASMGECTGVLREAYDAPYDPLRRSTRPVA